VGDGAVGTIRFHVKLHAEFNFTLKNKKIMENHIKLARAHKFISWFYGAFFIFILIILFPIDESDHFIFVPLILFGCLFALHQFTGKGVLQNKRWAINTSFVVALLMLLGFPIGTLIGLYLLGNQPKTKEDQQDIQL
jgi:fucose 4-O-acetylase-like acetyltransferase